MGWAYLAAGLLVGCYGTLVGVGGGFLLVPLLLIFHPALPPPAITAASLAVIFANTLAGSLAYARQRRIDYRSAWLFGIASVPGAFLGAWTVQFIPRRPFDLSVGTLLVALAVMLLRTPRGRLAPAPGRGRERIVVPRDGEPLRYRVREGLGIAVSLGVGALSTILGMGGGILHVPAMTALLGFPPHVAAATSHLVIAVVSGVATAIHWKLGYLGDLAPVLPWLTAGVLLGAPAGAALSRRLHGTVLLRLLAVALLVAGLRLLLLG